MAAAVAAPPKPIDWAEDEDEAPEELKGSDTIDENGIRTIIEYSVNDAGKKVKITRRIKRTLQTSLVDHVVAERKQWAKFGADKGKKSGIDKSTTILAEKVDLKLTVGSKNSEPAEEDAAPLKLKGTSSSVTCRLCKGNHFTAKCPHKEVLGGLSGDGDNGEGPDDATGPELGLGAGLSAAGAGGAAGSKYIPPWQRGAVRGAGETMGGRGGMGGPGSRDDLPTLRVTNVSEDAAEDDLRELFSRFGRVARVFIGKDRETGIGKGFAFVSYEDKNAAERAIQNLHGHGYDSLILSVQWSQPREGRP